VFLRPPHHRGPHLTQCFLGSQESSSQTAPQSVQAFLHSKAEWSSLTDRNISSSSLHLMHSMQPNYSVSVCMQQGYTVKTKFSLSCQCDISANCVSSLSCISTVNRHCSYSRDVINACCSWLVQSGCVDIDVASTSSRDDATVSCIVVDDADDGDVVCESS